MKTQLYVASGITFKIFLNGFMKIGNLIWMTRGT